MTSKEALKRLKQETAPATYMPDFDKNECIEVIKQDLERLKNLEDNIIIHKETIKMQQNQIESLQSENKEIEKKLKQKKSNFKNSQIHSKNRYKKLKEKNQELLVNKNVAQGIAFKLKEENDKLKKVIEDIKNLPNCDLCDSNWHKGCMCLQRKIKEVLGNEKSD